MQRLRAMPAPGLDWKTGGTPASSRFGDIYFSREGGLAETRHVFLNGCDLPEAWAGQRSFTIGELGFGTGLNFLATWALWRKSAAPGARLHYVAVEGYPLLRAELAACLAQWPELADLAEALLKVYPPAQPGFHRLFPGGGVTLTLLYGEAGAVLAQAEGNVDAWYLDGFAPEKNPEMWRAEVLAEVARLSRPGARLATFSAAGDVRRGLETVGFEVTKSPGFASKREMSRARFRGAAPTRRLEPWFTRAPGQNPARAVIVGGGIAGASMARALHKRGWRTTIVERHAGLADEASGNPAAVLLPRLTAAPNLDGRFYAGAWRLLLAALGTAFEKTGVLQLAPTPQEARRLNVIATEGIVPRLQYLSAVEVSAVAGVDVQHSALYFAEGGWVRPRALCAAWAADSELHLNADAAALEHDAVWRVLDRSGAVIAESEIVILANALGAARFAQTAWMPLQARRGQITLAAPTAASKPLRSVLSYGGSITPAYDGVHSIGATFDEADSSAQGAPAESDDDHRRNLEMLARVVPVLGGGWREAAVAGRAAYRCTTIDHLPVAGPVPDVNAYRRNYADLARGHPWARYPDAAYLPGLYTLTGLGSRGMVSAPMAAEVLAAEICGEPWPLERDLVTALHPGRFLVRDLKRRQT